MSEEPSKRAQLHCSDLLCYKYNVGGSLHTANMNEQWRELRGHDFLPDQYILHNIPTLYATEDVPVLEKTIYIHYSIPASQLPFD